MKKAWIGVFCSVFFGSVLLLSCNNKYKLPIGSQCDENTECASGLCLANQCVDANSVVPPTDILGGDAEDDGLNRIDSWEIPDSSLVDDGHEGDGCESDPGGFLCPCDTNGDCNDGFCVPTRDNSKVCTSYCKDDCPGDWTCSFVQFPSNDSTFICVQPYLNLCRPCSNDLQCQDGFGGDSRSKCVLRSPEEGAFCGIACEESEDCPSGYACEDVESLNEGLTTKQCVPMGGELCGCTPLAVAQLAVTPCQVGDCLGRRVCEVSGLSDCLISEEELLRCQGDGPPRTPSIEESIPASPSSELQPTLTGFSDLMTTVALYDNPDCEGPALVEGAVNALGAFSFEIQVPENERLEIYAQAENNWGDLSACSEEPFVYIHDNIPPSPPLILGSFPESPSHISVDIELYGTVDEDAKRVSVFLNADCAPPALNTTLALDGAFSLSVAAFPNQVTTFYAEAEDAAGNVSPCSLGFPFVHDDSLPAPPRIEQSFPPSPSRTVTEPEFSGSAEFEVGTFFIYGDSACQELISSGDILDYGFTFQATVLENSRNEFYTRGQNEALRESPCSAEPFVYVHDSVRPDAPVIRSDVASPSNKAEIELSVKAEDGASIRLFQDGDCESGEFLVSQMQVSGSVAFLVDAKPNAERSFYAEAIDAAGNVSPCSLPFSYVHDGLPPEAPVLATSPVSPSNQIDPDVVVETEARATVALYQGESCDGELLATLQTTGTVVYVNVRALENSTSYFSAKSTDQAGNVSPCSAAVAYVHSNVVPDAPVISSVPESPSYVREPSFRVMAGANYDVFLYEGGSCSGARLAEGKANASGVFEKTLTVRKNEVSTFTARAKDLAGTESGCSQVYEYRHDEEAPPVPVLTTDPLSPSGSTSLSVTGKTEAGATVYFYKGAACNNTAFASGLANGSGNFTAATTVATNVTTKFYAKAVDEAGNESDCSPALEYVHDNVKPAVPVLSISPASPSNNASPSLTAKTEAGVTVYLYKGAACSNTAFSSGKANGSGNYTATAAASTNATSKFYAKAVDAAGNESACSGALEYVHDNEKPPVPVLSMTPGPISSVPEPSLTGKTEAGATVYFYKDSACKNTAFANGEANSSGNYTATATPTLNSTTKFYAKAVDAAGNESDCSGALEYTHDDEKPPVPTLSINPGPISSNASPVLTGQTEAGALLTFFKDSACVSGAFANGTANSSGSHSVTASPTKNAVSTFYAKAVDPAGNESDCSSGLAYTHDSEKPPVPVLTIDPRSPSSYASPVLHGKTEASARVYFYKDSACGNTAFTNGAANAGGTFSATASPTLNSTTKFYAKAVDAAGNESNCSGALEFIHDNVPPPVPTLSISPGSPSNNASPTLTGKTEGEARVYFYKDSACGNAAFSNGKANSSGNYTATATANTNNTTQFYAKAVDAAGNESNCSGALEYVHDNQKPPVPTLSISPGSPSNNASPTLTGKTEGEARVYFYKDSACGNTAFSNGRANSSGNYTATATANTNNTTQFYAKAVDAAGNESNCSGALEYVHDNQKPPVPTLSISPGSPSNNASPTLTGKTEGSATVYFYKSSACGNTAFANGIADSNGNYTATASANTNNTTQFYAKAVDAAGNESNCSGALNYVHDSVKPAVPILSINPASPSNNASPSLTGKTEAGARVYFYKSSACGNTAFANGIADSNGNYTATASANTNNTTNFYAKAVDAAGNASNCSGALPYTHDNVKPPAPTLVSFNPASPSKVRQTVVNGVYGPGAETSRIYLYKGGSCSGTAFNPSGATYNGSTGVFNISMTADNLNCTEVSARAQDSAGNWSNCSNVLEYTHYGCPQCGNPDTDWLKLFGAGGLRPPASTVDAAGNVYVALTAPPSLFPGGSGSSNDFADAYVLKYSPLGELLWWTRLSSTAFDGATAIVLAPAVPGNPLGRGEDLWVAGDTEGSFEGKLYDSRSCDPGGFLMLPGQCPSSWVASLNPSNGDVRHVDVIRHTSETRRQEKVVGIVPDPKRNRFYDGAYVLVASANIRSTGDRKSRPRILKASVSSALGSVLEIESKWKNFNGAEELPTGIATDKSGDHVFIHGYLGMPEFGFPSPEGGYVYKFDVTGSSFSEEWLSFWGSKSGTTHGMDVGTDGNVYVVGSVPVSNRGQDAAIAKFNPDGTKLWEKTFGSSADDVLTEVKLNGSVVHVAGQTHGNLMNGSATSRFGGEDFFMAKVSSSSGNLTANSLRQYGSPSDDTLGVVGFGSPHWYFVGTTSDVWMGMHKEQCSMTGNGKRFFISRFNSTFTVIDF